LLCHYFVSPRSFPYAYRLIFFGDLTAASLEAPFCPAKEEFLVLSKPLSMLDLWCPPIYFSSHFLLFSSFPARRVPCFFILLISDSVLPSFFFGAHVGGLTFFPPHFLYQSPLSVRPESLRTRLVRVRFPGISRFFNLPQS